MTRRLDVTTAPPGEAQLSGINAVIEAAVMGWDLPARVKRLVLPSYRYTVADLDQFGFALAYDRRDRRIIGVAAWEPAERRACPGGMSGMLLHGLYVAPQRQRRGIGRQLLQAALEAAAASGCEGLLVKAQRDAESYFLAHRFTRLPVDDELRQYAHRLWCPLHGLAG